jgi:hypothetical protein
MTTFGSWWLMFTAEAAPARQNKEAEIPSEWWREE